jgi:hypothetical protein
MSSFEAAHVGRLELAAKHAGVEKLAFGHGPDGEMRAAVARAFARLVEDLPVDEASVSGKAYAARADASEREGYLRGRFA